MTTTVTLQKVNGRIGITIGGGAPYYQSIFIIDVQIKSPASRCKQLFSGDEIVAINRQSVIGSGKCYAARLVSDGQDEVVLEVRRWIVEEVSGKTDIAMKALKHRMVEKMSTATADSLGLCHAAIINDKLTIDLSKLDRMTDFCKEFASHLSGLMLEFSRLSNLHKEFGDIFGELAAKEKQIDVSSSLSTMAQKQRKIFMEGCDCVCECKKVLESMHTLIMKAIPDTKLTIDKYADLKYEYLAHCLKVHQLEQEEISNYIDFEPWSLVYAGWEREYRDSVFLRQKRRDEFNKMRVAVFNKIRMLEVKLQQDLPTHMEAIASYLHTFYSRASELNEDAQGIFPIPCTIEWGYSTYEYVQKHIAFLNNSMKCDDEQELRGDGDDGNNDDSDEGDST